MILVSLKSERNSEFTYATYVHQFAENFEMRHSFQHIYAKKTMKICLESLRESKNEAKVGQERLTDAKMEAKRRPKRG